MSSITTTTLDITHCPVFYLKLNSISLSGIHRKHITSPLRARQVNAIYRFVTMVYKYNYHNSGHYPSSCLLLRGREREREREREKKSLGRVAKGATEGG
jgi:hypothetical protein